MRGRGRPDFAILKPVKGVHRNYPGRKGDGDFEHVSHPHFEGVWHGEILPCGAKGSSWPIGVGDRERAQ